MKEGPRFLNKERLEEKAEGWEKSAHDQEKKHALYTVTRLDQDIAPIHGISFIKEVIPDLISKKKNGEKVKILDLGAGAAFFTDEIRKEFGDKVEVFSTGLRKRKAKDFRAMYLPEEDRQLHPNDLKWRSVLQLSDFEEFDLIVDTFGELNYTTEPIEYNSSMAEARITEYLTAVIKKLKPGGLASIAPFGAFSFPLRKDAGHLFSVLEKELGVKITIPDKDIKAVKIEKPINP